MLKKVKGGLPKVHIVVRGVIQKSTSVHKGGGGSKMAQNWSTWFKDDPISSSSDKSEGKLAVHF